MGQRPNARTVLLNMAQQCSVLTTEESELSQKGFRRYCHHVVYQHPSISIRTPPSRQFPHLPCKKYLVTCRISTQSGDSTTTSPPTATCTGTKYTVASADTCQSISKAKSIATDRLISSNGLDYNCTSLKAGTSLCLGQTCALQTIMKNQSCQDITNAKKFTYVQLISWNP